METRRNFINKTIGLVSGIGFFFSPFFAMIRSVYAQTRKIILPKWTKMKSLVNKNPADLDTRNLEIIPLKDFGTMGVTDYEVNLVDWRLEIAGYVKTPLALKYQEVLSMPSIERKVLLICPGIFANYGAWTGVSINELLKAAGAKYGATHITVKGPEGSYEKTQRYPIADISSDKVFLAYKVNGKELPQKHGFPLRIVAEGYYGYDWIKYVYKITIDKI
ncbi:MAG: molybdopterin-dependent oxidoreductase [Desulfobacteraceae bacterium]|nr:MAG: molybdopterin-dependent oxidoreductase [Desulfobacteraceae bacterium]